MSQIPIPFQRRLRELRKARCESQAALARRLKMSRQRLSNYERGVRVPSEAALAKLAEGFELAVEELVAGTDWVSPGELHRLRLESRTLLQRFRRRRLYRPRSGQDADQRVATARRLFGALADQLLDGVSKREDADDVLEFLPWIATDSARELMFVLFLLAEGARRVLVRLGPAGFDAHPVVDLATNRAVGSCEVPGLYLEHGGLLYLFVPHVGIRTRSGAYVLDFLVCVRGRGAMAWIDVEIDGSFHEPDEDQRRQANIGLPTLRYTRKDLSQEGFMKRLLRELTKLARLRERDDRRAS